MMTYVSAFIFYTLAMIGVMLVGFIIYKKTFTQNPSLSKGLIKIIDSAPLGNKKMLHIVKIKNECFLIASGLEHTTFLAKLEHENSIQSVKEKILTPEVVEVPSFEDVKSQIDEVPIQKINPTPKETRYDDPEKLRAVELQRQFRELYEKDDNITPIQPKTKIDNVAQKRKQMLKNLLKEFHADTSYKSGSKI